MKYFFFKHHTCVYWRYSSWFKFQQFLCSWSVTSTCTVNWNLDRLQNTTASWWTSSAHVFCASCIVMSYFDYDAKMFTRNDYDVCTKLLFYHNFAFFKYFIALKNIEELGMIWNWGGKVLQMVLTFENKMCFENVDNSVNISQAVVSD